MDGPDGHHNNCATDLGYHLHASWAANFYYRFTGKVGAAFNVARLYAHVWMNTTAFLMAAVQFDKKIRNTMMWLHKKLGWAATILATGGTLTAMWLGSEHSTEDLYGGSYAMWGWTFMGLKWMTRWWGTMWGAFLVFRVVFLLGGFFRFHPWIMIQISI